MPTWGWYVGGAALFILVYLYFQSSQYKTASPVGRLVVVPNSLDLSNYNGDTTILTTLLNQQGITPAKVTK